MSHSTPWLAALTPRVRIGVAVAVAVILLIGSVGGYFRYRSLQDSQPTQATLNLKDKQSEVAVKQPLTISLQHTSKLAAVEAALRIDPVLEGHMTATADRRHFSWTPTGAWADLTTYTVTLNTFKDARGVNVTGRTWHFTTTIVPRVVSLVTDGGVTTADGSELPLASNLKVLFNTSMDVASVQASINGKGANLQWSEDGKQALISTKGFNAGNLDIAVDAGRDRLGHFLADPWKIHLALVFGISGRTTPLRLPAIVQIPNDNYGARDQSGVQFADIVFEYLTEGSITRLSAVFTRVPDVVGPIRSGRVISFKITRHYRGINYFSGLSSGSYAALFADGVPTLFDTQGYYYRSNDRFPPNNLYIKGEAINRWQAANPGLSDFTLKPGSPAAPGGSTAESVIVAQHNSTYNFDPITGTYTKTEDGHLMSDALISQPLHIGLLIVLHSAERVTNIVEDIGGSRSRDFDLDSGGQAEFYFHGAKSDGRWSAPDKSSPLTFQLSDGKTFELPHALVWIDVVGN